MSAHNYYFDKSAAQVSIARRQRQEDKVCRAKSGFATREDARLSGRPVYECPFCGLWHRSGELRGKLRGKHG